MEGDGGKLENPVLESESLNGQEKLGAETVEIESTKGDEKQKDNGSSSSSDDESDRKNDKDLDKPPESLADLLESDGNGVVAVVEVPIGSSGSEGRLAIEGRKEGTPPEVEGGFSSSPMSSIELAKEAIVEAVDRSGFVSSVKSTKEELTDALASVPFSEVQQEVEKLAVTVESATRSDDGGDTEDTTKVKASLPLPLAQGSASWKSCCGMFNLFFT